MRRSESKEAWLDKAKAVCLPENIPGYDIIRHILIDGKTQRGNATSKQKPNHIVSAVDENRICYRQELLSEKSNEITAIPKLIGRLNVKDHIVTIDAMGTQTEISKQITEKKADYVLGLKGNQGTLQLRNSSSSARWEIAISIHSREQFEDIG